MQIVRNANRGAITLTETVGGRFGSFVAEIFKGNLKKRQ